MMSSIMQATVKHGWPASMPGANGIDNGIIHKAALGIANGRIKGNPYSKWYLRQIENKQIESHPLKWSILY